MENLIKMDDLGVPLFSETSTSKPFSNLDPVKKLLFSLWDGPSTKVCRFGLQKVLLAGSKSRLLAGRTERMGKWDVPPGSLTVRPWKYTILKGKDRLPTIIFQGRAVKLREGTID